MYRSGDEITRYDVENIARDAANDVRHDLERDIEDERSARRRSDDEIWEAIRALQNKHSGAPFAHG